MIDPQTQKQTYNDQTKQTYDDQTNVAGSLGAKRVRESFNPSKDSMVDKIKRYTADLIDPRLAALAQTAYEEAAMWAVKAATTTKP
jgi:hypothetical protein